MKPVFHTDKPFSPVSSIKTAHKYPVCFSGLNPKLLVHYSHFWHFMPNFIYILSIGLIYVEWKQG